MKIIRCFLLFVAAAATALSASAAKVDEVTSTVRNDSINRAVATVLSSGVNEVLDRLQNSNVPVDRAAVGRYIATVLAGDSIGFTREQAAGYVDKVIYANMPEQAPDTVSMASQKAFIDSVAALPGAVTTPTGLVFVVITEGKGIMPTLEDRVDVRYVARLSDGTVFDDTGDKAVTFDVARVVPGFTEGLRMMKSGGKYRVIIPSTQAYGEQGIPGIIPGNSALDFTVILDAVHPASE